MIALQRHYFYRTSQSFGKGSGGGRYMSTIFGKFFINSCFEDNIRGISVIHGVFGLYCTNQAFSLGGFTSRKI